MKRKKIGTPSPKAQTASGSKRGVEPDSQVSSWIKKHSIASIALVSLLAVMINCYPVVFCGKSFVSPTSVWAAVYSWWPPLPGMQPTVPRTNQHGSDTGATSWWGVPIGFAQSRDLLQHGELPLWDRYGHTGSPLIGQAVSMLGDPLHMIVILGGSSALAWDLKFLVSKLLFCIGFGLLIRRLTGNNPLALVYAALAAYCGAYFYIANHPAFFELAYSPWILLSGIEFLSLRTGRYTQWGLAWLLANFGCFNAGHLEVGVVLIGGLNLAALGYALTVSREQVRPVTVLARIGIGTLIFLGVTAPFWISFLVALDGAYSAHTEIKVEQLPMASLPGIFDDIFYRILPQSPDMAPAPGTSLLILVGFILSLLKARVLKIHSFFWVNLAAILLWGGCVFGWVPAFLLVHIPMLNKVGHLHTDFSYLLVIHLTIQSALGFQSISELKDFKQTAKGLVWAGTGLVGMLLVYSWANPMAKIPSGYLLCTGVGALGAPLVFAYLVQHRLQWRISWWALILVLGFIPIHRFGLYTFGTENLLMPGPRVALDYPSQALENIRKNQSGPSRVVGLQRILIGDYAAVYGLEDIRSCAPLSNGELISLVRSFPGVQFNETWYIDVIDPVRAQPLLNLLNVKYLLLNPTTRIEGLPIYRVSERSDLLVLDNPDTWPRAFFTNKVQTIASSAEFVDHLLENGKEPFVAITPSELEKEPGLSQLNGAITPATTPASNYQLLPNTTSFDIHASSAGVVCLTEGQARDFVVKANNETKKVLTVNRAFKGVYLDKPGDYHIEFTYRPRFWSISCSVFWISVLSGLGLGCLGTFRIKSARENACISEGKQNCLT